MKIIAISDTHQRQTNLNLPKGDVLIHAGDMTMGGSIASLAGVATWFEQQDFKHKIIISGNHDWGFANDDQNIARLLFKEVGVTYLQDDEIIIDGIKIYGAPWQPWFNDWAWNLPRGEALAKKWALIPDDTNVLVTHGPPYGILDLVEDIGRNKGRNLHQGCEELTKRVLELKQLKVHIFGHLHLNGGKTEVSNNVTFANAAICTEKYEPINPPIVIEI